MRLGLYCVVAALMVAVILSASYARAQALSINDYSYDTVCDFTNRYFIKLKRRIDPKEWDAILKGRGVRATVIRKDVKMTVITYRHNGVRVKYSFDDKKKPHIWQVDLDRSRISQSLRSKEDFAKLFKITPDAMKEPVVSMECDGAMLHATVDNHRVTKLSLVIPPSPL